MLNIDSPLLQGLEQKKFDTSFRKWLIVEEILYSDIAEDEKTELIHLIVGTNRFNDIINFLKCGSQIKINSNEEAEETNDRPYSYVYDWDLIYSAFLEQYGIDLIDNSNLHYWKFKALFNNLHDTMFNKVMEFRLIDLDEIENDERRAYYEHMKELYSLPKDKKQSKEVQEKIEYFNSL